MRPVFGRVLFWLPRVVSILFAVFLAVFALDAFREARGFWVTAGAFLVHLIPSFVVLGVLLVAWRWEWVGAVMYALAAAVYATRAFPRHPDWFVAIGLPLVGIAGLFLLGWVKRGEIRQTKVLRARVI